MAQESTQRYRRRWRRRAWRGLREHVGGWSVLWLSGGGAVLGGVASYVVLNERTGHGSSGRTALLVAASAVVALLVVWVLAYAVAFACAPRWLEDDANAESRQAAEEDSQRFQSRIAQLEASIERLEQDLVKARGVPTAVDRLRECQREGTRVLDDELRFSPIGGVAGDPARLLDWRDRMRATMDEVAIEYRDDVRHYMAHLNGRREPVRAEVRRNATELAVLRGELESLASVIRELGG